jgi:peptidoglycan/xylan/chitin deacetylase (PgdA/CDA1 family)
MNPGLEKRLFLILSIVTVMTVNRGYADNVTLGYHMFDRSFTHLYSVLPEVFEWQLDYLKKKGIPVITMDRMLELAESGGHYGNNVLLTCDDGWRSVTNIVPALKKRNTRMTFFIFPDPVSHNRLYLSGTNIRMIEESGVALFGCHSFTHRPLLNLNRTQLKHEIVDSAKALTQITGTKPWTFAYPYGEWDTAVRDLVRNNYKLAFGVLAKPNGPGTDRYNLNRYLIYKTTTFGEFMNIVSETTQSMGNRNFEVLKLDFPNSIRNFESMKMRLFRFFGKKKGIPVLIIPDSALGPGWAYALIGRLQDAGVETYVMTGRNSSLPFERLDRNVRSITNWGLKDYRNDIRKAVDSVVSRSNREMVVLTWGDGFDMLMAVLSTRGYTNTIRGIVAVNPSLRAKIGSKEEFGRNAAQNRKQLASGKYAPNKFTYYMKIKVLSDLMVLKPDSESPFCAELGYRKKMSNKNVLKKVIDDASDPETMISYSGPGYTLEDYKQAFMSPLPVFSVLVPLTWIRDLNVLWQNGFVMNQYGITDKAKVNVPVMFYYSKYYKESPGRLERTFPGLQVRARYSYPELSTLEMLLSTATGDRLISDIRDLLAAGP